MVSLVSTRSSSGDADDANVVWQIAQRDYKFGKGKHSSLTKATYDAVGDRFRSLWGKEAGWAHSILFTADLRVFSERLSTKTEVTKVKHEGADPNHENLDSRIITKQIIKREFEESDTKLEPSDVIVKTSRVKRRRKA